jgi:exosortase
MAAVAMLWTIAGVILRLPVRAEWRGWLPVWAALWLVIPPPLGWDVFLIQRLQHSTSRTASLMLDTWGVRHLMEGNVLVLPNHRLLVEEACSGINSTVVLLAAAVLFAVAARRPAVWSLLLIISSIVWSAAANMVRVVAVAVAQSAYNLDWSSGWQHELLGFGTFLFALWMLFSTDRLLAFLLSPIPFLPNADDPDSPLPEWDVHLNPLSRLWNLQAGVRVQQRAAGPLDGPSGQAPEDRPRAVGRDKLTRWFAVGFAGLGALQLAAWCIPLSNFGGVESHSPAHANLHDQADLPVTLAGWKQVDYAKAEFDREMGRFQHVWTYRSATTECLITVEYPFVDWHDVSSCYVGNGWTIDNRRSRPIEGASIDPYFEVELCKPADERGLLLFCNVQESTAQVLTGYSKLSWQQVFRRVRNNLYHEHFSAAGGDLFQIQLLSVSPEGWSDAERESLAEVFVAARQRLIAIHCKRSRGPSP